MRWGIGLKVQLQWQRGNGAHELINPTQRLVLSTDVAVVGFVVNRVEEIGDDRVDDEPDIHRQRSIDAQDDGAREDGAVEDE